LFLATPRRRDEKYSRCVVAALRETKNRGETGLTGFLKFM